MTLIMIKKRVIVTMKQYNYYFSILGSGIDKFPKYKETTNDSVCTQYSSANCDKY